MSEEELNELKSELTERQAKRVGLGRAWTAIAALLAMLDAR
jgi:hypothetical protein